MKIMKTEHLLDNEEYHAPFDNNTVYNASSTAHGFMPILSGDTTTFLDGAGAWTDPSDYVNETVYRKFSTGASTDETTFWTTSSTNWNASAVATSYFYPVIEVCIPQWIQQSRVTMTMVVAACTSATAGGTTGNSGFYIKSGRGYMGAAGLEMPGSTLYTMIPNMISYYAIDSGTSGVDTYSTQLNIIGGETFTIYALSTESNQIKLTSLAFSGISTDIVTPGTTWDNIMLTTNV